MPVDGELRFPCFDTWAPCTLWCDGTNQCGYEDSDQGHVSYIGITSIDERYCNHSTNSTETMRPEPSVLQIVDQELDQTLELTRWRGLGTTLIIACSCIIVGAALIIGVKHKTKTKHNLVSLAEKSLLI